MTVWKTDVAGSNCFGLCPDGKTYKKSASDPCTPESTGPRFVSGPAVPLDAPLPSNTLEEIDEDPVKTTYDMPDPVIVGFSRYDNYPKPLKKPLLEKYIKDQWFSK